MLFILECSTRALCDSILKRNENFYQWLCYHMKQDSEGKREKRANPNTQNGNENMPKLIKIQIHKITHYNFIYAFHPYFFVLDRRNSFDDMQNIVFEQQKIPKRERERRGAAKMQE